MLGELVVGNSFGWLLGELVGEFVGLLLGEIFVTGSSCFANMVVLATMEVLDVLVVTGSSCLINNQHDNHSNEGVPNATKNTNTNDATPIIMNLPHFTVQLASALLSSSS